MIKCLPIPVRYSELIKKEVINTCDGCRLGYVCDLEIDSMCGRINALFIPQRRKLFAKPCFLTVKWEQIERIGADMILVKLPRERSLS
ncbi:MAG: YlmC/YmxH family sporulation protein [Clostridia bacterium]|nr:YlmC/YmxH family sporulation protein [Clostridia bacterium]